MVTQPQNKFIFNVFVSRGKIMVKHSVHFVILFQLDPRKFFEVLDLDGLETVNCQLSKSDIFFYYGLGILPLGQPIINLAAELR